MLSNPELGTLYDRMAAVYDDTRPLPPFVGERLAQLVLHHHLPQTRPRILEIGVGTGRIAAAFVSSEAAGQYVGLDVSVGMLDQLRSKLGDRVEVVVGDALGLPFDPSEFDIAISCHVLQLLPDQLAALGEIQRVLKPGGFYVHCIEQLPPHQQTFDQAWQHILAELDDSYVLATRYDMRRDDFIRLVDRMANRVEHTIAAEWEVTQRVGQLLGAVENKAFASCHRVSDVVYEAAVAKLRSWTIRTYGSLDAHATSKSRMDVILVSF